MIWVTGLLSQSAPAEAILEPGSACGMPCAPEDGLSALALQSLSRVQSESRQPNWSAPKPNSRQQGPGDVARVAVG